MTPDNVILRWYIHVGNKNKTKQKIKKQHRKKHFKRKEVLTGIFEANRRGFGFVIPDDGKYRRDIFIDSDNTLGAWNGDHVQIEVFGSDKSGRQEGAVRKILTRAVTEVVGTFERSKNYGFVVPDSKKLPTDIFIGKDFMGNAKDGQVVVAEILEYGTKHQSPTGKITQVIGNREDAGVDIFAIAKSMDIPMEFSVKQMNQAQRCQDHVIPNDFSGREDFRNWRIVTIDGPDAKDLDDAVSVIRDDDGTYTLGVHIADVSNYVQENSALDREALKRGTSVYLADRVIPMLPFQLSNGICSLNAGEDRLTLSVIMKIDAKGKITDHRICESVIRVGERMSYPDVRAILEDHDPALCERYHDYVPMFELMLELSRKIRARRRRRGAIDFDFPEGRVILNEKGIPVDVVVEEANCATRMIEDFMLSANETVAEEFVKRKLPFVYRIHEDPDPDKVEDMLSFVRKQGVSIEKKHHRITPKEIQEALDRIHGKPEEAQISRIVLRSMSQARYSTECTGHFGLAARYYCHFTSPIRRYPDLQIHRIIHDVIRGRMTPEKIRHYKEILDNVCTQCSVTERRADECERETTKLKKAQYMSMHIGEVFEGVISGVTGWGLYVELSNTCEGLVPIGTMNEDYFEYHEDQYALVGRLGGKIYQLGDPVRVKMESADLLERTVDFSLAD